MAESVDFIRYAYEINAIAFLFGVIFSLGAIGSFNDRNWAGIFLTLPFAVLSMFSSFLLSISCMIFSWKAGQLVCFAISPLRSRLLDKQRDFVWGFAQYSMLTIISILLLTAMAYRYYKPMDSYQEEKPLTKKDVRAMRLAVLLGALLSLWPF